MITFAFLLRAWFIPRRLRIAKIYSRLRVIDRDSLVAEMIPEHEKLQVQHCDALVFEKVGSPLISSFEKGMVYQNYELVTEKDGKAKQ